jgi:hypothetical protein
MLDTHLGLTEPKNIQNESDLNPRPQRSNATAFID